MRRVLASATKDLRRLRRDPYGLALCLGLPILIGALLVIVFGHGRVRPRGLLLIADEDDSLLSSILVGAYSRGELGEILTAESVLRAEGERRIGDDDGSALLIVPEGFGEAFLAGDPVTLDLVTNPRQTILPEIIEEVTSILVEAGFYVQRLFGDELRAYPGLSEAPSDEAMVATGLKVWGLYDNLRQYLDPPAIELASVAAAEDEEGLGELMFPSILYMAVLLFVFGIGGDLWKEKTGGTLRRAMATPAPVASLVAGKVLSVAAAMALVAAVGLTTGRLLVGLEIHRPVLAATWIVVSGIGLYLLVVMVQIHAATERAASVLSSLLLMVLAMLGGSFFPFEMMPDSLAEIGRRTPNGWALSRFRQLLAGEDEAAAVAAGFAVLAVVIGVLFVAAVRRIKRGFAH